jgi:hypothetical protein
VLVFSLRKRNQVDFLILLLVKVGTLRCASHWLYPPSCWQVLPTVGLTGSGPGVPLWECSLPTVSKLWQENRDVEEREVTLPVLLFYKQGKKLGGFLWATCAVQLLGRGPAVDSLCLFTTLKRKMSSQALTL